MLSRLARGITNPRLYLGALGFGFLVAAWLTLRYPPDYLHMATLWAALVAAAGALCIVAAWRPGKRTAALAGALAIGSSAIRSVANLESALSSTPRTSAQEAALLIAAILWGIIALSVAAIWVLSVQPWSVRVRAAGALHPA